VFSRRPTAVAPRFDDTATAALRAFADDLREAA
jgi:hypothetical protein